MSKKSTITTNPSIHRSNQRLVVIFISATIVMFLIVVAIPNTYKFSFSANANGKIPVKIYWNQGKGFSEIASEEIEENTPGSHQYSIKILSLSPVTQIRIDVGSYGQNVKISNIECNYIAFAKTDITNAVLVKNNLSKFEIGENWLSYQVDGTDPYIIFSVLSKRIFIIAVLIRAVAFLIICLICIAMLYQRESVTQRFISCFAMLRRNRYSLVWFGIFIVLLTLTALFAVGRVNGFPDHYDSDLYHAQTVRWIKEYPVVPGLGNLHLRLAFNNSWFLLAAFTDTFDFEYKSYHLINSFLFIVIIGIVLGHICSGLRRHSTVSTLYCMAVCLPLVLYTDGLNSFSTDMPSNLLVIFIISEVLVMLEGDIRPFHVLYIAFLVCVGITIKLILLPFVLLPFLLLYYLHTSSSDYATSSVRLRTALGVVVTTFLIIVPWSIRSLIQTGYLLWPIPDFDPFGYDWKVPVSYVKQELLWIRSWPFSVTPEVFVKFGLGHWLSVWVGQYRYLVAAVIVFTCLFNFILQRNPFLKPWRRKLLTLHLAQTIAVLYWIVNAPDIRFGFGIIIAYLGVMIAVSLHPLILRLYREKVFGIAVLSAFSIYTISSISNHPLYFSELPTYTEYPTKRYRFNSGLEVWVTVAPEDRCGNTLIPCIPFHYSRFKIEPRGNSNADGFKISAAKTNEQ